MKRPFAPNLHADNVTNVEEIGTLTTLNQNKSWFRETVEFDTPGLRQNRKSELALFITDTEYMQQEDSMRSEG